jgi:hypothetical protein
MAQEAVNLIGQDQFFERNIVRLKPPRKIHGLLKSHISIVVALDQ